MCKRKTFHAQQHWCGLRKSGRLCWLSTIKLSRAVKLSEWSWHARLSGSPWTLCWASFNQVACWAHTCSVLPRVSSHTRDCYDTAPASLTPDCRQSPFLLKQSQPQDITQCVSSMGRVGWPEQRISTFRSPVVWLLRTLPVQLVYRKNLPGYLGDCSWMWFWETMCSYGTELSDMFPSLAACMSFHKDWILGAVQRIQNLSHIVLACGQCVQVTLALCKELGACCIFNLFQLPFMSCSVWQRQ